MPESVNNACHAEVVTVCTMCLQASSLQQQPTAAYGLPKVALLGKLSSFSHVHKPDSEFQLSKAWSPE